MRHQLDECDLSTNYQDECDICGELTACTCLASIVKEWEIAATGSTGNFAYRYQYQAKDNLIARFGYAPSYREAMDAIAHAVICEKENA